MKLSPVFHKKHIHVDVIVYIYIYICYEIYKLNVIPTKWKQVCFSLTLKEFGDLESKTPLREIKNERIDIALKTRSYKWLCRKDTC